MLTVAVVYPDVLSTYGDSGNALVLRARAQVRGIASTVIECRFGESLPHADIYLIGGGEDGPQRAACDYLRRDGSLGRRIDDGAHVLAVCAGFQILGASFEVGAGEIYQGLDLLPVVTTRGTQRSVGDLVVRVGSELLVGFENHGGVSTMSGGGALGEVVSGFGNDGRVDGASAPGVTATYAHGPVLALNPWLADEILARAVGYQLEPYASVADDLHLERCRALGTLS